MSALAGVLCPPRWACLPICLPPGFVFHLGWGAVSASLGLSPNLSPTWLCLSPWLGCCVRLAGLVSQFVSHLALSFSLAGVLCPPRWACLRSCLCQYRFRGGAGAASEPRVPGRFRGRFRTTSSGKVPGQVPGLLGITPGLILFLNVGCFDVSIFPICQGWP